MVLPVNNIDNVNSDNCDINFEARVQFMLGKSEFYSVLFRNLKCQLIEKRCKNSLFLLLSIYFLSKPGS